MEQPTSRREPFFPARTYSELEERLRTVVNFGDPSGDYDFVGISELWLALLENLRQHHLEVHLDELRECLSEQQLQFLQQIIDRDAPTET